MSALSLPSATRRFPHAGSPCTTVSCSVAPGSRSRSASTATIASATRPASASGSAAMSRAICTTSSTRRGTTSFGQGDSPGAWRSTTRSRSATSGGGVQAWSSRSEAACWRPMSRHRASSSGPAWCRGTPGPRPVTNQLRSSVRPTSITSGRGTPAGSDRSTAASRRNRPRSPRQQTRSTVVPPSHASFELPPTNTASGPTRDRTPAGKCRRRRPAACSPSGSSATGAKGYQGAVGASGGSTIDRTVRDRRPEPARLFGLRGAPAASCLALGSARASPRSRLPTRDSGRRRHDGGDERVKAWSTTGA